MPMTRRDKILKWTAYLAALVLAAAVNYYVLGPLPIALPLVLPVLAVAGGVLEGAPFGAIYGAAAGLVMSGLGHLGFGCLAALAAVGWASGLAAQYALRRDVWGHLICSVITLLGWELWAVAARLLAGTAPGAAAGGRARAALVPGLCAAGILAGPVLLRELREDLP